MMEHWISSIPPALIKVIDRTAGEEGFDVVSAVAEQPRDATDF